MGEKRKEKEKASGERLTQTESQISMTINLKIQQTHDRIPGNINKSCLLYSPAQVGVVDLAELETHEATPRPEHAVCLL